MKRPRTTTGLVMYTSNGDGYHIEELEEIIAAPKLRWVKIVPGCEMPAVDERVLVLDPLGWTPATRYVDKFVSDDDDGCVWLDGKNQLIAYARVELPNV